MAARRSCWRRSSLFFFNDTATTEIYTLSLHDALPISGVLELGKRPASAAGPDLLGLALGSEGALGVITELTLRVRPEPRARHDRKSTRLNSSHANTSYAVFCLQNKPIVVPAPRDDPRP